MERESYTVCGMCGDSPILDVVASCATPVKGVLAIVFVLDDV
jgi:hypothetical protein